MVTLYQKQILAIAKLNGGRITKAQAVESLGHLYYCNPEKHIGDVLSRMVNARLLTRVKPGVFDIGTGIKKKPETINSENQKTLF